jgi:hypothetical protein
MYYAWLVLNEKLLVQMTKSKTGIIFNAAARSADILVRSLEASANGTKDLD